MNKVIRIAIALLLSSWITITYAQTASLSYSPVVPSGILQPHCTYRITASFSSSQCSPGSFSWDPAPTGASITPVSGSNGTAIDIKFTSPLSNFVYGVTINHLCPGTPGQTRATIGLTSSALSLTTDAPTASVNPVCAGSPFTLRTWNASEQVLSCIWQQFDYDANGNVTNITDVGTSNDKAAGFPYTISGIYSSKGYRAQLISCNPYVAPGTQSAVTMVNLINSATVAGAIGTVVGDADVLSGQNSGEIALINRNNQLGFNWEYQEEGEPTWTWHPVSGNATYEYSNLTKTTKFRASQTVCGQTYYTSTSCTVRVYNADDDKHWTGSQAFNQAGVLLSDSRTYFDSFAKQLQSQQKNLTAGAVLATQPLYGKYGQAVGSTLPAPITPTDFAYQPTFVTPASAPTTPYNYTHFDETTTRSAPQALATATAGTLGNYYSANNTREALTPITGYPFGRADAEADGSTGVTRSTIPGDAFRLGQGKESISGSFSVSAELNQYLALRNKYYATAEVGASATSLANAGGQQVTVTPDGQKTVTVTDKEGHTVMSMRPGTVLTVPNAVTIGWAHVWRKTAGQVYENPLIDASADIMVYDGGGNWVYTGSSTGFTWPIPTSGYVFYSINPFTITTGKILVGTQPISNNSMYVLPSTEEGPQFAYYNFYTLTSGAAAITPLLSTTEYELKNTVTGASIAPSSLSSLPAGFYQIKVNKGKLRLDWTNAFGDISYNFYNQKGQLIGSLAPNGVEKVVADFNGPGPTIYTTLASLPFFTRLEYDVQGRLLATTETDAGRTEFIYRADGKPRFSQNAKQVLQNRFSYTNYDVLGRAIEVGEAAVGAANPSVFSSLRTNNTVLESNGYGLVGISYNQLADVVRTIYDSPNTDHGLSAYQQSYLLGKVSTTTKYATVPAYGPATVISKSWYSYDEQGRTQWQLQQTTGQPVRTLDYIYDASNNVASVCYQQSTPAERLTHYYTYDADNRLSKVTTNTDLPTNYMSPRTEHARYTYYLHGPLRRITYGGDLQGVDYTYTVQGWLKSINDGDLSRDPGSDGMYYYYTLNDFFGTSLHYYQGDYTSAAKPTLNTSMGSNYPGRYDGTISGLSWQSLGSPKHGYGFRYDAKSQLIGADYGLHYNFTGQSYGFGFMGGKFSETVPSVNNIPSYDLNGNIQRMRRTDGANAALMDITYNYQPNTNKLTSVVNGNNTPVISYAYNEIGQATSQVEQDATKTKYLQYDAAGKITGIYRDAAKTQPIAIYSYDEFGRRLTQQVYTTPSIFTTTTFVRDASGSEMATYVYSSSTGQTIMYEQPIYGATRLGTYRRQRVSEPAEQLYELSDHLGNTRVVFRRPQVTNYLLSMEDSRESQERSEFQEPSTATYNQVRSSAYARTQSPTQSLSGIRYSIRLANTVGPGKTLAVDRGDKIHLEVYAAYTSTGGSIIGRPSRIIPFVTSTPMASETLVQREQQTKGTNGLSNLLSKLSVGVAFPVGGQPANAGGGGGCVGCTLYDPPVAQLQYVVKDASGNYVTSGVSAVNSSSDGQWQLLALDVTIDRPGTIQFSVQSYNATPVYFDDLLAKLTTSPIVQENHFYAYGQRLLGNYSDYFSWERQGFRKYRHGYQGQFATVDDESGYDAFELRDYDSRIGRWLSVDPKRQFPNPYIGMGNNPAALIDADGGEATDIIFRNNKGKEIGRILQPGEDQYVDVPTNFKGNITIDPQEISKRLGIAADKLNAVGLGVNASATFGGGGNAGLEFVYFLNGPDKGKLFTYSVVGTNLGFEAGVGGYGFGATKLGNSPPTGDSWTGWFNSWSGGFGAVGGGYFWGTKKGHIELWPNQLGEGVDWSGVTVSGAFTAGPDLGGKWSASYYRILGQYQLTPAPVVNAKPLMHNH